MTKGELTMEPYAVMDPSGEVKGWLDSGRGIAVWPCLALDSGALGTDCLTPADLDKPEQARPRPGWRYAAPNTRPARVLMSADEVIFFQKLTAVADFSDSPRGYEACYRWLERTKPEMERTAPIGRVLSRYTVERLCLLSTERNGDGSLTRPPLLVRYRMAVIQWSATIRADVN